MKFRPSDVKKILYDAFRQGLTPHKLSMTCALGIVFGIFPVFGTTTLLCFAIAVTFRLNIPVIQLVNYMVTPLQILLIIPFIKVGTLLFHLNPVPYDVAQMEILFRNDFLLLMKEIGLAFLLGIGVWASFSIPLYFVLYFIFFLIFSRWLNTSQREL